MSPTASDCPGLPEKDSNAPNDLVQWLQTWRRVFKFLSGVAF